MDGSSQKIIIFSAPSGAGKTTIVKHLLSLDLKLEFSISAVSRKKRENEIDGKDYYFISADEFREKIYHNEFLEWEEVYDEQYYGTLKSEVERIRAKGHHVIFDVDVVGGLNIKEYYKDNALSVFIMPPSKEILEQRLRERSTENEDNLTKRIEKAEKELFYAELFDKVLINDNLKTSLIEAEKIVSDFLNF